MKDQKLNPTKIIIYLNPKGLNEIKFLITVLSLINAPGALQFFKRGMFIRGKFSMQKCSV